MLFFVIVNPISAGSAPNGALVFPAEKCLINFNGTIQVLPARADHGSPELMKTRPWGS